MGEKSKERPASADAASRSAAQALQDVARATTGVAGLDAILGGGLLRDRAYLVEGEHGSGKTTLGLRFCIAGAQLGEQAQGVTVILVMSQHGLSGSTRRTPFDLSYVADSVLLFQSFDYAGELRRAISVYKRRGGAHEPTVRELQLGADGIHIGEPLREFQGILAGTPRFMGTALPDIEEADAAI